MSNQVDFNKDLEKTLALAKGELESLDYQYREIKSRVASLEKQSNCEHDLLVNSKTFLLCCVTCTKCGYSVYY